jgi:hypothetical protein
MEGRVAFRAVEPVTFSNKTNVVKGFFFVIPFHLQSVPIQSANCVKTYTVACRRVLSSAPL